MRIKCINDKGSKYLLKDHIYTAKSIWTRSYKPWGKTNTITNYFVRFENNSTHNLNKFVRVDGKPFPTNYTNPNAGNAQPRHHWNHLWNEIIAGNIKVGSGVQCKNMNLKSLKFGETYTITEIDRDRHKIKVKGQTRKLKHYNFQVPDKKVARKNSLAFLLGNAQQDKEPIEIILKFMQEYKNFQKVKNEYNYGISVEDLIAQKVNTFDKETIDRIKELKIGDLL